MLNCLIFVGGEILYGSGINLMGDLEGFY
uniref:Uncharacterized protein n=1 Tax=Arundo donax TaxID=35708 RepID=A0A0A9B3C1_ARUDO